MQQHDISDKYTDMIGECGLHDQYVSVTQYTKVKWKQHPQLSADNYTLQCDCHSVSVQNITSVNLSVSGSQFSLIISSSQQELTLYNQVFPDY